MNESKAVYRAIANVILGLSKVGIAKDSKNTQQGYAFRGIDAIYGAVAPFLAAEKLCILPRVLSREVVERQTAKGSAIFYVTVKVEFDFVSADDGSLHTVSTYGEAMDTADKATNKAMSAAYKYACLQAFCIPTDGDNDADAITHEVASAKKEHKTSTTREQEEQESDPRWLVSLDEAAQRGMDALLQAFKIIPAGKAKSVLWETYGASLKETATIADDAKRTDGIPF
jgi:hypothetical protein